MKRQDVSQRNKKINSLVSEYFLEIERSIKVLDSKKIEKIIEIVVQAYRNNKTVYILGNGGAASTASHFASDLGKGTLTRVYDNKEKRVRVISLTDNVSLITAYSNDISYNNIFLQQLRNLLEKNDVVIGISGSGNSENVLRAIKYAKKIGASTIGLTGFSSGGKLATIADISVIVKSNHYGPVEDIHLMIAHIIAAAVANIKRQKSELTGSSVNKSVPFRL